MQLVNYFVGAAGAGGDNHEQVMLALVGIVATSVAALVYVIKNNKYVKTAAKQSTQANAAVNNVGPGQHKLYDMVSHIREDVGDLMEAQRDFTKKGWAGLQPPIDTAIGLTTTIIDLQNHAINIDKKLDQILKELEEHVSWEMDAQAGKYAPHKES